MIELNKELLRKSMQGVFIESIIHDLNNPLGSISLIFELLRDMKETNQEDDELITTYYEQVAKLINKCSKITKSFLSFANLNPKEASVFNSKDKVEQVISFAHSQFRKHNITLSLKGEDSLVYGNEGDFNLLLLYLIYAMLVSGKMKSELVLHCNHNSIIFEGDETFTDESELYNCELFSEGNDIQSLIKKISTANNFEIALKKGNFLFSYPQTES